MNIKKLISGLKDIDMTIQIESPAFHVGKTYIISQPMTYGKKGERSYREVKVEKIAGDFVKFSEKEGAGWFWFNRYSYWEKMSKFKIELELC